MLKSRTILRALPLAALMLASSPAAPPLRIAAAENAQTAEERTEFRRELFAALKSAPTEAEALQIVDRIWRFWITGPNDDASRLLEDAMGRRQSFDYDGALAALDILVETEPGWSEAWNQRAFVQFLREEYAASLADIERTLALEPKHFGALAGKVNILMRLGENEAAQETLRQVVGIHPWIGMRVLLEEPAGRDI